MLKTIRKHNKWLMVGFGVLLMVTWLVQPAINQFQSAYQSRTVGKLDGKAVSARQMALAYSESSAVIRLIPGVAAAIGLEDRDPAHWLLLTREAEDAGFIGGARDGEDWNEVTAAAAYELALTEYGNMARDLFRQMPQLINQFVERATPMIPRRIQTVAADQHMTMDQVHMALSKARGVKRMVDAYRSANRMSDRSAMTKAREYLDGAKANYVFIPAERLIDSIPDPDAATLQAHFDAHKTIKPGDGDTGIGYLLPSRVKLEYMKLDRAAIEAAITPDPVEVRRRYNQGKGTKYTGEFSAERPRIEQEMKAETVERIMQEAHVAVQTGILRTTKALEPDGRYKKLPADWAAQRPKFETIAQAVVEAVRKATGITIPLPTVNTKAADWLTRDELRALPDIGQSQMRAGGLQIPFDQIVFWTKELPGGQAAESLMPVQAGIPLAESYLTDFAGNRFYMVVLDTKGESSPESVDERREQIVKDYKKIKAFEQLKGRTDELRSSAVTAGLDAVVAAFPAVEAPKPDPAKPDAKPAEEPKHKPLDITKDVNVGSEVAGNRDPIIAGEDTYKKVLEAAAKIDPLLPPDKVPADAATLSIPLPKRLGLVVVRIQTPDPVTTEKYRQFEALIVQEAQRRELSAVAAKPEDEPFSFGNLLKRHRYTSGERDIKTVEDLKKDDQTAGS